MADEHQGSIQEYRGRVSADIEACVSRMGCQPILFIGSGLSKRYFSGPSWDELLETLAKQCPLIDKDYAYYKQTLKSQVAVGEEFARLYQQWAWGKGRNQFPADMFNENVSEQAYIKYSIAHYLNSMIPTTLSCAPNAELQSEIASLQAMGPHAVITTNYDRFLEMVFPEYQPIIGQSILHGTSVLYGELFKIHGCVSDSNSLVFTERDYEEFSRKKKYLSAKLLTYFSEHPLLFVGYSASDPNIRAILSDIDEALPRAGPSGSLIPNIYILEWNASIDGENDPPREKLIAIEEGRSIRINAIETGDFKWVFDAFGARQPLNRVSPKFLRALLHRSYDLVRYDIPRKNIQANFQLLERSVSNGEEFAKLFGITTIAAPSFQAVNFPYTLSEVAEKVIGKEGVYWGKVQCFIDCIKRETGVDIKTSDNQYHSATRVGRGKNSIAHKYSDQCVDLLIKVANGEPYEIAL